MEPDPDLIQKMQPVIGISAMSTDSKSLAAMVAQVRAVGAIPMVFANHSNRTPEADIAKCDAIIGLGNDYDIPPELYTDGYDANDPRHQPHAKTHSANASPEARARLDYELRLATLAAQHKIPTVGVCGFMHVINTVRGGGLLQHIPDLVGNEHHAQNTDGIPPYSPVMPVDIEQQSMLGMIASNTGSTLYTPSFPPPMGMVGAYENSFHHQAVDPDRVGNGLRVTAWSDSYTNPGGEQRRLPEAIEPDPNGPLKDWPMLCVQWHPEFGASQLSSDIIGTLVAQAALYAQAHPRDRSNDQINAMAVNIVSAGKNTRVPAEKAEGYAAAVLAKRQLLDPAPFMRA